MKKQTASEKALTLKKQNELAEVCRQLVDSAKSALSSTGLAMDTGELSRKSQEALEKNNPLMSVEVTNNTSTSNHMKLTDGSTIVPTIGNHNQWQLDSIQPSAGPDGHRLVKIEERLAELDECTLRTLKLMEDLFLVVKGDKTAYTRLRAILDHEAFGGKKDIAKRLSNLMDKMETEEN